MHGFLEVWQGGGMDAPEWAVIVAREPSGATSPRTGTSRRAYLVATGW